MNHKSYNELGKMLDIYPPFLLIDEFKYCRDGISTSKVISKHLEELSKFHLPSVGSPIPACLLLEAMLQTSAMTIYVDQQQFLTKAFIFQTKMRIFNPTYLYGEELIIECQIKRNRRSIIDIDASCFNNNILAIKSEFKYKSDFSDVNIKSI